MSLSPLRKIWISLLSILAMLMSSFVSSAPIMTFQILSATSVESMNDSHCGSMSSVKAHHTLNDVGESNLTADLPCGSDDSMAHNCCGAVCATVFALFAPVEQNAYINSNLALIHPDSGGETIYRQASLYRPPIA